MAEEKKGVGEDVSASYRRAGPYLDASWQLTGSVAVWTVAGFFLDKWLKTAPWLLVTGAVIGIGIGFYLFFRAILSMASKQGSKQK